MKLNNMTLDYKNILALAVLLAVITAFVVMSQQPPHALGSVQVGNQYQATTTPQVADMTNLCPARLGMASSTTGVLGAVNITAEGTGALTIYDATTTNANLRAETATSSLILADFPANAAENSYHFDIEFKRGLLVDYGVVAGAATTTISYRCEG